MITLETLATHLRNGILLVRQAAASTVPLEDIFDTDDAGALRSLAETYFGESPFTGYQRRAIAAAETQQHSLDDLQRIERHVHSLKTQQLAWRLREHLCGVPGENIDTEAREQLKKLLPQPSPPPMGVKIRRGKNGAPDTLIYRGPSKDVARLYDHLDRPDTSDLFEKPHNQPQRYNLGDSRNQTPEAAPHIILTLDNLESLKQNKDDVILTLTNGARMTGAEWVTARLHEVGFITLIHPVEGPVNLYRTERFPNLKQRLMAAAESPLCSYPGCRQPASRSQIHHITAWKHGGKTNAANLTVLCAYHNARNNDDPEGRGRMERQRGGVILT